MATTNEIFPPSPKLVHSPNTRGEMGMFVDWQRCTCSGCAEYRDQMPNLPPAPPAAPAPRPTGLAHTRNVDGRLGMFVDWQNCPCYTCEDYRAEQGATPPITPSLTTVPPSLPPPPPVSDLRSTNIQLNFPQANLLFPTALGRTDTITSPSPFPESLMRLGVTPTAWGGGSSTDQPARRGPSLTDSQFSTIRSSLLDYSQVLRERQDALDHSGCRSHDEMAAQDAEWDDLDRQIDEIDEILACLEEY